MTEIKTTDDACIAVIEALFYIARKDFKRAYRRYQRLQNYNSIVRMCEVYAFYNDVGTNGRRAFRLLLDECEKEYGVIPKEIYTAKLSARLRDTLCCSHRNGFAKKYCQKSKKPIDNCAQM